MRLGRMLGCSVLFPRLPSGFEYERRSLLHLQVQVQVQVRLISLGSRAPRALVACPKRYHCLHVWNTQGRSLLSLKPDPICLGSQ